MAQHVERSHLILTNMSRYEDGFDQSAEDTLSDEGTMVEPDVRRKISDYIDDMGLKKEHVYRVKISDLRRACRAVLEGASVEEAATTMTRSNFMTASDDAEGETLEEFADWAADLQSTFDQKRYEIMARQIYNSWPNHGADVDWSIVIDHYFKNRTKNLHTEVDRDKLYEMLLSYAEDHYDGSVPPTTTVVPTKPIR